MIKKGNESIKEIFLNNKKNIINPKGFVAFIAIICNMKVIVIE